MVLWTRAVWTCFSILILHLPESREKSMTKVGLYTEDDKIELLNNTNFQAVVCGSEKAWLVEFYSSWCGHCINFAPAFKEFAAEVFEWRDVISVAAIDCANEANSPTCREYEVMGYPSIKLFKPSTLAGDMGELRQSHDKSVPGLKKSMLDFVENLEKEGTWGKNWPNLMPFAFNRG